MSESSPQQVATPQQVAEACREAMWADDHATKLLGMRIEAVGPGTATLSMVVRRDMLNGHATCHGGLLTSLADSAFGFACNGYNEVAVAAGFDVNLMAPGREGDVLTATAREVSKTGRTGVYDVDVCNQRGERLAVFRGRSYTLKGKPLVPGLPMGKQPSPAA
jgi:acyl-CoA thioesterase